MIAWWEGQLGSGHRQAEVALMLVIEAGTWLLDVPAVVRLDEIQVVPQNVSASHTPTTDHEGDRQANGLESDGRGVDHECRSKCLVWWHRTQG